MRLRRTAYRGHAWAAYGGSGASVEVWRHAMLAPVKVVWPGAGEVHLQHGESQAGATAWRGDAMYDWRAGGGA